MFQTDYRFSTTEKKKSFCDNWPGVNDEHGKSFHLNDFIYSRLCMFLTRQNSEDNFDLEFSAKKRKKKFKTPLITAAQIFISFNSF